MTQTTLGASDIPAILGLSPWATPYTVWAIKTGRLDPQQSSDAMDAGLRLEHVVLDWARLRLGDIRPGGEHAIAGTPIVCHPDGLTLADRPVEAKTAGIVCPLRGSWGPEGTDEVPDAYLVQVLVQMAALGVSEGHLAALLGGMGFRLYHIVDDRNLRTEIVERACAWWERHVVQDVPPCVTADDLATLRRLRRIYTRVQIPSEVVDEWLAAKAALRRAQDAADAAEAKLLAALGDADEGECARGLVTHKLQHRKAYTVKACEYRVLRFKEWPDE
jgi:putative phage-type endonuclease